MNLSPQGKMAIVTGQEPDVDGGMGMPSKKNNYEH